MERQLAARFDRLTGLRVDENLGGVAVSIQAGSFCVFDARQPSNGLHAHACWEVCLATGGSGEYLHGGVLHGIREGDVFLADPGVVHEIRRKAGAPPGEDLHLVFFTACLDDADGRNAQTPEGRLLSRFLEGHAVVRRGHFPLLAYLHFLERYGASSGLDFGLRQTVRNLALECLFSLVPPASSSPSDVPSPHPLDLATAYVTANLHRRILLAEAARAAHTSGRTLQNLFRRNLDLPFRRYVNQRRMHIAAGYLKMNFPVADVARRVGIEDPAQFSRLFKRHYGVSPKRYQLGDTAFGALSGLRFPVQEEGSGTTPAPPR